MRDRYQYLLITETENTMARVVKANGNFVADFDCQADALFFIAAKVKAELEVAHANG